MCAERPASRVTGHDDLGWLRPHPSGVLADAREAFMRAATSSGIGTALPTPSRADVVRESEVLALRKAASGATAAHRSSRSPSFAIVAELSAFHIHQANVAGSDSPEIPGAPDALVTVFKLPLSGQAFAADSGCSNLNTSIPPRLAIEFWYSEVCIWPYSLSAADSWQSPLRLRPRATVDGMREPCCVLPLRTVSPLASGVVDQVGFMRHQNY